MQVISTTLTAHSYETTAKSEFFTQTTVQLDTASQRRLFVRRFIYIQINGITSHFTAQPIRAMRHKLSLFRNSRNGVLDFVLING